MDDSSNLPLFSRRTRQQQPRLRNPFSPRRPPYSYSHKDLIHIIPVIVFLAFFILWWFSYPVKLIVEDGKIIEIVPIETPIHDDMLSSTLNDSLVELTVLAYSITPIASTPLNQIETTDEPTVEPMYNNTDTNPQPSSI